MNHGSYILSKLQYTQQRSPDFCSFCPDTSAHSLTGSGLWAQMPSPQRGFPDISVKHPSSVSLAIPLTWFYLEHLLPYDIFIHLLACLSSLECIDSLKGELCGIYCLGSLVLGS